MPSPLVTVVAATHNRADMLGALLDALAAQEGVEGAFEVVIVDDASTDRTPEVLAARAATFPVPLQWRRQDRNAGPAAARNRAWRLGTGSIVAFTDDDCRPSTRWVAELVAALETTGADIVQGRTEPDPDQEDQWGPFSRSLEIPAENAFYETCNMGYRRAVLDELGGFDESFRYPYGEDCDLAWRARKAGYTTTFSHDAVVRHAVHPSDWRAFLRDKRRSEGLAQMLARHPEIRTAAGAGIFWRKRHRHIVMFAGAAVAAAAIPRSRLPWAVLGAAALRYSNMTAHALVRRPGRKGPADQAIVVPMAVVGDVYEVGVLARASLKHHVLVL